MPITKVMVSFDDTGKIFIGDAITYKGELWFVPKWLEMPALGHKKPERIVLLKKEELKPLPPSFPASFLAPTPLPKVLESAVSLEQIPSGYVVEMCPDIEVSLSNPKK